MSSHNHLHNLANHNIFGDMKSAVKGVHGAGEALRGSFNGGLDGLFHDKEAQAKDKEVADKGKADWKGTEEHFSAYSDRAQYR